MTVAIEVQGDFELAEAVVDLTATVKGLRGFTRWLEGPALTIVLRGIRRQFETEGRFFGSQWAGLAESTKRVRSSRGYQPDHPILRQSDELYDAATTRSAAIATEVSDRSTLSIDFGSVPVYGFNHLLGVNIIRGVPAPMPIRSWLPPDGGTPTMNRALQTSLLAEVDRRIEANTRRRARRRGR